MTAVGSDTMMSESEELRCGARKKLKPYVRLNLLTKREHEKDKCELCERIGSLMCRNCQVTFYCGMEHYTLDKVTPKQN